MRAYWFVYPGGCLHTSLYVPDGNLVFALVPGGLHSGSAGWCFHASNVAPETGRGRISLFLKGSCVAVVAHLHDVSVKEGEL